MRSEPALADHFGAEGFAAACVDGERAETPVPVGFEMAVFERRGAALEVRLFGMTACCDLDVVAFETVYFDEIGLIPEIVSRYRSSYFAHIVGAYAAGYYGYIWSGVLDNDSIAAFEETSIIDQETAQRFRTTILERTGSADFMEMWVDFRGREPEIEPLLRNRGLL